jgi:hypothetical protein
MLPDTALQLGPSPSQQRTANPLLLPTLRAEHFASNARGFYCFDFLLLYCLAARLPRQTAINGTVQNNAGEDRVDGAR